MLKIQITSTDEVLFHRIPVPDPMEFVCSLYTYKKHISPVHVDVASENYTITKLGKDVGCSLD